VAVPGSILSEKDRQRTDYNEALAEVLVKLNNTHFQPLSAEQVAAFHKDGVLIVPGFYNVATRSSRYNVTSTV